MHALPFARGSVCLLLLASCGGAESPPAVSISVAPPAASAPVAARDVHAAAPDAGGAPANDDQNAAARARAGDPLCYAQKRYDPDEGAAGVHCAHAADIQPASPCPASYAAAHGVCGMHASKGIAESCTYPQGQCSCTSPARCSGMPPKPAQPTDLLEWVCTPKHKPPRTDGCPVEPPSLGTPCNQAGKQCAYGTCGGPVATCHAGHWVVTMAPPPP